MIQTVRSTLVRGLGVAALAALTSACSTPASTPAAGATVPASIPASQRSFELAVACRTNDALADNIAAEQKGGPGAQLALVERIIILTEAGRASTAAGARDVAVARLDKDPAKVAELDRQVAAGVDKIRAERRSRTGKTDC